MLTPARRRVVTRVSLALAFLAATVVAGQQSQPPQTFRAGVVLVPVDVRAVDADGRPVTDLTAADFTVFEDGVKQSIAHFSTQSHLAHALAKTPPRMFAFVFGVGRMNKPGQIIEAVIDFVRSRLRPDDRVGLVAYHHATDLTTDHDAVVRLLERYRARNDQIEKSLDRDLSVRVAAPNYALEEETRLAIRTLFDAPGLPAVHVLPDGAGGWGLRYMNSFYLGGAVEYLRHVEGEKHLVFLSEDGSRLPARPEWLAHRAAAARVTVSLITQETPRGRVQGRPFTATDSFDASLSLFVVSAIRGLAEQTGGSVSFYEPAATALTRLAHATSFQYLLGYYPTAPPPDGQYRRLRVTVKRRGMTVLYRHGYEAQPMGDKPLDTPLDVRRVLTESRIRDEESRPWPPVSEVEPHFIWSPCRSLSGSVVPAKTGEALVNVAIVIDPSKLFFRREGDQFTANLDVALFVDDAQGRRIGEGWERLALTLDPPAYSRMKEQIPRTVAVNVTRRPARVTVIIYEYDSDHAFKNVSVLR